MLKGKRCQILNKKYLQSRDEIGFFLAIDNEVKSPLWDYRPKGLSPCREQETSGVLCFFLLCDSKRRNYHKKGVECEGK